MDSVLKVFVSGSEQDLLAEQFNVIEKYSGFILLSLAQQDVAEISTRYPTENITDQYIISAGQRQLDTAMPRVDQKGKTRSHPDYKGVKKLSAGFHHYLIQFIGPIKKPWLKAVVKAGGKLQSPFTGFSYVVRTDEASLAKISALPFVRWAGHLSHSDRVSPSVMKFAKRKVNETGADLPRSRVLPGLYEVEFFDNNSMKLAAKQIREIGFNILETDKPARLMILQHGGGVSTAKRVRELSAVHGVRFIREHSMKRTSNDLSPRLMGAGSVLENRVPGLDGSGEVVAVCDTGLDTGDAASIHADFKGRIVAIDSYPIKSYYNRFLDNPGGDDGAADFNSGHGTHVTGSVLGDGTESFGLSGTEGPIRGLAYKAKLVFQAVEQEMKWKNTEYYQLIGRYTLAGIPNDIQVLFADAYAKNARIHSNSWGGGEPGEYDSQSEQLDRFVWEHKDFCVLVAAGNDGTDQDGDGSINPTSVTSPATAKNCICVGASENERPDFNANQYGNWWSDDYPVAPYNSDPMADDPDEIVAFSSRGPTQDGRIRPDIVAPGTFILSTRSSMIASNNMAWGAFTGSNKYFHMGGTSMATPLAAGAATLVRQHLRKNIKLANPSAALIKASLIAGARRLPNPGAGNVLADNDQGYGRVDLQAVIAPDEPASVVFMDVADALETGDVWEHEFFISSVEAPLRLVLCYSDYPGENLVNNLNLIITSPEGTRHVGNPSAADDLTMDSTNNVEAIQVNNPSPGKWKIEVVGSNVPESAQDFALVLIAALGEPTANNMIRLSSSPKIKIPDNDSSGIVDSITVAEEGVAISVEVDVNITHSYIGDLSMQLISPDGLVASLHARQGASSNNINKHYDVHNTADLQLLAGSEISGDWELQISDLARFDTGSLNQWSLQIIAEASDWEEVEAEVGKAIPDNKPAGIKDKLTINRSGQVKELEVWVDITHTWIGDLKVVLSSPAGINVVMHDRIGGRQDNLIKLYDIDTLPTITEFIDSATEGDWTLSVSDNEGRDTGKLNAWGLRVKV